MGEHDIDVVHMALELRQLNVQSIPINFLHPIAGTPLAGLRELNPRRCLKTFGCSASPIPPANPHGRRP